MIYRYVQNFPRGRPRGFFPFQFSFSLLLLLCFWNLLEKMKISGYQRFSLKIPVSVDKHNLFILINAKYNLWKQPKTLYIQKILKPPTTSFGILTTTFWIHFTPSNYDFLDTSRTLIFRSRRRSIQKLFVLLPIFLHSIK